MLGVQYHRSGDLSAARKALHRADPQVLAAEIFIPFIRWVLKKRIPTMFLRGGQVAGSDGQGKWAALSKWTIASKGQGKFSTGAGARGNVLTPMVTAQMKMAQDYAISYTRTGTASWLFELVNKARSTSKWSPGFDYPTALHEGWGPYTVKPRPDGPGFLAWRSVGQTIGASMGRIGNRRGITSAEGGFGYKPNAKTGKAQRVKAEVAGGWVRAMVTHPSGAPPRPHIKFFAIDAIKCGALALAFVFRGVKLTEDDAA